MKKILLATLLVAITTVAYPNYSMLTCNAQRGTTIQVYLNGKLINKKPLDVVRLKSKDGCNSVLVVVHSRNQNFSVQRDLDVDAGYDVYLNIRYDECGPKLIVSRRSPLVNPYYARKLYTRQFIS